jgi:hypothetical protein
LRPKLIQAQGINIKNLENQVVQIATAFRSRLSGTLSSISETAPSTSNAKNKETSKVISLGSGREYEGSNMGDTVIGTVVEDINETIRRWKLEVTN